MSEAFNRQFSRPYSLLSFGLKACISAKSDLQSLYRTYAPNAYL